MSRKKKHQNSFNKNGQKNQKRQQNERPKNQRFVGVVGNDGKITSCSPGTFDGPMELIADEKALIAITWKPGDILVANMQVSGNGRGLATAIENLGNEKTPGILNTISIYEKPLRTKFNPAAMKETENKNLMKVPALGDREDLRDLPIVTIDPVTARDYDDAVYAKPLEDGGFHLIVAIADVSYYVRQGSEIDKEALARGNSTYVPGSVVPMLLEELSNELCSLKGGEERATMDFHMWIDKDGNLKNYDVKRGLIRSKARLTYEQVQAAKDGNPDAVTAELMNDVINPLYAAYEVLKSARERRTALDLDTPEYKLSLNDQGEVLDISSPKRIDSQRLIEEFMVLSNVVAATALEDKGFPCVYRVHDEPPSPAKCKDLAAYLSTKGIETTGEELLDGEMLKKVLTQVKDRPDGKIISEQILRILARATYDTANLGHFGLDLECYAHATSPIRRYADLLVHRLLVTAYKLGEGGADERTIAKLREMAEHATLTERTSDLVERAAKARMTAKYLAPFEGQELEGHITNVNERGLFVQLNKSGGTGFLPVSGLPQDFYTYNAGARKLYGINSGCTYSLGDAITVRLKRAYPLTGKIDLTGKDAKPASGQSPKMKVVV